MPAKEQGFKLANHHGGEMKKIGILGGMSPESTTLYYEHITRTYTARFGDYGYPEILIYSVNFQNFVDWQHSGQWNLAARAMAEALERLRAAGADLRNFSALARSFWKSSSCANFHASPGFPSAFFANAAAFAAGNALSFASHFAIAASGTAPKYIFCRRDWMVPIILSMSDVTIIRSDDAGGSSVTLSSAFCASVVSSSASSMISVRFWLAFGFCQRKFLISRTASMPMESAAAWSIIFASCKTSPSAGAATSPFSRNRARASAAVRFPTIPANSYGGTDRPALRYTALINPLHVLDRGPGYQPADTMGAASVEPPRIGAASYGVLVPQVDADGNDIGGNSEAEVWVQRLAVERHHAMPMQVAENSEVARNIDRNVIAVLKAARTAVAAPLAVAS